MRGEGRGEVVGWEGVVGKRRFSRSDSLLEERREREREREHEPGFEQICPAV